MASIKSFKNIIAWQKAKELSVAIYKLTAQSKDYGYKDQLQRASVSVMNNIAEGFERQTNKEFKQFLYIAKGSCGEVRSMIRLGEELSVVSSKDGAYLVGLSAEIARLLSGFIKKL